MYIIPFTFYPYLFQGKDIQMRTGFLTCDRWRKSTPSYVFSQTYLSLTYQIFLSFTSTSEVLEFCFLFRVVLIVCKCMHERKAPLAQVEGACTRAGNSIYVNGGPVRTHICLPLTDCPAPPWATKLEKA